MSCVDGQCREKYLIWKYNMYDIYLECKNCVIHLLSSRRHPMVSVCEKCTDITNSTEPSICVDCIIRD